MTLSPIHWVPVQDKGSKIPFVKFGAMKIIQSDPLHQEYLTIDLGNTSDCERWRGRSWATGADWGRDRDPGSLSESLTESLTHSFSTENAGAGAVHCQFMFQTLHETSQDGSSLAFFAAAAGWECNIQDARGRGLCFNHLDVARLHRF